MKKSRQFLPLLKHMLGFYRFGPLPLLIYVGAAGAVLAASLVFLPIDWMSAREPNGSRAGSNFASCLFCWYFLQTAATGLPFVVLGGSSSLEFLFSRAIDRGIWLRTERLAVIIFALGPLILNLALSHVSPELAFERAPVGSEAASLQARYQEIFPGSHWNGTDQLVIRHGTEAFAAWSVWVGLTCIFLVAAYFSIVFTAWQRAGWHHSRSKLRPWLGGIMVNAPAILPVLALAALAGMRINLLEESFLLFARHPIWMTAALVALILSVQPMTERNIRTLEFEFF